MVQWKHLLSQGGTNFPQNLHTWPQRGHTFLAFYSARRTMLQWKHLFRQGQNGTIKTFVPPGTKCYNKNICYRKAHNGNRRVTPPGSGNKKKRSHGSHVSSILGRKAHNGTIKTFVPPGTKWYNENICYRKAHNGTIKTFCPWRHKFPQNPHTWPQRGHTFLAF
jgi:hypothetical protein